MVLMKMLKKCYFKNSKRKSVISNPRKYLSDPEYEAGQSQF